MKLLVYLAASAALILPMAWLGARSSAGRGWLLTLLIVSTGLGAKVAYFPVYTEGYRGTDVGVAVYFTDLVCAALLLALVVRFPRRLCWIPYNTPCMAAFFLVACLSTMTAEDPQLGLYTLFAFAKAYAVYWCVVNCLRVGVGWHHVWCGFVGAGLLVAAVAAKEYAVDHVFRVSALFEHSNSIPTWAFCFMPALLIWGMCDRSLRGWRVWLTVLVTLGLCATIVRTQSRAGVVALAGVLVMTLSWALLRSPSARVRRISAGLGLVMAAGAIAAAPAVIERFNNAPVQSSQARQEFNAAASRMASDAPFSGVGLNNYSHALGSVEVYHRMLSVTSMEAPPGTAHQTYLLTAAETGWVGLALFVAIAGRFLALALTASLRSKSVEAMVCFGMFTGWCAVFAIAFLEWVLRQTSVMDMGMIAAAVTVVLAQSLSEQPHAAPAAARSRQPILRPVAAVPERFHGVPMSNERGFSSKPC